MKMEVANEKVTLKLWEGHGKKRVYLVANPADGSKAVGRSYDWGYVDTDGPQDTKKGGYAQYRYAQRIDPEGFEALVEAAQAML